MGFRLRATCTAILVMGSAVSFAKGKERHFPTPSVWVLDLPASQFLGSAAMKSVTLTVTADASDKLTFQEKTVLLDGKGYTLVFNYPEDGKLHPFPGGGTMKEATWPNGRIHRESSGATLDGEWTIARDEQTATLDGTLRLRNGIATDVHYVYRRSKA